MPIYGLGWVLSYSSYF